MPEYDSSLLRVWRSRRARGWEWALRLEHLQSGEQQLFDDPAALVDALWELAEAEPPGGSPRIGGREVETGEER